MVELLSYLKDRYFSGNKSEIQDSIARQKVKNSIESLCKRYLKLAGETLDIEVSDADLPYALEVIDDEPLRSRYKITQTGVNMLQASLKDIELADIFEVD